MDPAAGSAVFGRGRGNLMYAALITGVANYLRKNFDYTADQVRFGGTDSFWNKFHMERVKTPGVIYGVSQVSFPKGFSAHKSSYLGATNASETKALKVRPVLVKVDMTLGMLAENENEHFEQIHKYVEMATFHACLDYFVKIPGMDNLEHWACTVSDFAELSPPPTGKETSTYDTEGRIYKLEGTFSVNTQFFLTEEGKLVRCIHVGNGDGDLDVAGVVSHDSDGNRSPLSI